MLKIAAKNSKKEHAKPEVKGQSPQKKQKKSEEKKENVEKKAVASKQEETNAVESKQEEKNVVESKQDQKSIGVANASQSSVNCDLVAFLFLATQLPVLYFDDEFEIPLTEGGVARLANFAERSFHCSIDDSETHSQVWEEVFVDEEKPRTAYTVTVAFLANAMCVAANTITSEGTVLSDNLMDRILRLYPEWKKKAAGRLRFPFTEELLAQLGLTWKWQDPELNPYERVGDDEEVVDDSESDDDDDNDDDDLDEKIAKHEDKIIEKRSERADRHKHLIMYDGSWPRSKSESKKDEEELLLGCEESFEEHVCRAYIVSLVAHNHCVLSKESEKFKFLVERKKSMEAKQNPGGSDNVCHCSACKPTSFKAQAHPDSERARVFRLLFDDF